jgi:hypothetical protein
MTSKAGIHNHGRRNSMNYKKCPSCGDINFRCIHATHVRIDGNGDVEDMEDAAEIEDTEYQCLGCDDFWDLEELVE